jgi:hypothetical protein
MKIGRFGQQQKDGRGGYYSNRGQSKRWEKQRASRKMRRLARRDPEGAPTKRAWWGWD